MPNAKAPPRIRVGGGYPTRSVSFYQLVFTLGHELAHAIDPCTPGLQDAQPYFDQLSGCYHNRRWLLSAKHRQCGSRSHLAEVFADHWATDLVVTALASFGHEYSSEERWASASNAIVDLCGLKDDQFELDFTNHPRPGVRVGRIFASHGILKSFLSCENSQSTCNLKGKTVQ